mmetsp:Transcript_42784/g.109483  ORF Transcript_42784/g.109483 Transcript_42784/m.109483 type:complete len:204 (+) Transcript_42784:721-1332(+)
MAQGTEAPKRRTVYQLIQQHNLLGGRLSGGGGAGRPHLISAGLTPFSLLPAASLDISRVELFMEPSMLADLTTLGLPNSSLYRGCPLSTLHPMACHAASCFRKPELGSAHRRFSFTSATASSGLKLLCFTRYAATVVALRETPAMQCTRTLFSLAMAASINSMAVSRCCNKLADDLSSTSMWHTVSAGPPLDPSSKLPRISLI